MKLLIAILFITGCATLPVEAPKEEKPAEVTAKDYWPTDTLRQASIKAIKDHGGKLLDFSPKDKAEWCWKSGESAVSFYNRLFSAIAKFESNYKADTVYKESFKDRFGNNVLSVGIMQNSQESCTLVYRHPSTTQSLKDPYNNLSCSVKIAARWIPSDSVIAQDSKRGLARYYSTMRGSGKRASVKSMVCR